MSVNLLPPVGSNKVSGRRTGKFRPGRPKILTVAQLDCIEKWFTGYYKHRIMSLQDIIRQFDLRCSPSTLLRALHKRGFHTHTPELKEWLSPKINEQRLGFALQHRGKTKKFWRKVSTPTSQLSTPGSFEDLRFGAREVIDIDLTVFNSSFIKAGNQL
jgi:Transposase